MVLHRVQEQNQHCHLLADSISLICTLHFNSEMHKQKYKTTIKSWKLQPNGVSTRTETANLHIKATTTIQKSLNKTLSSKVLNRFTWRKWTNRRCITPRNLRAISTLFRSGNSIISARRLIERFQHLKIIMIASAHEFSFVIYSTLLIHFQGIVTLISPTTSPLWY